MLIWNKMQDKKTLILVLTKCCKVLYSKPKTVRLLALIEEWIFLDKCSHKLDISFSHTLSQEIFLLAYSIGRTLHDAHLLLWKCRLLRWKQRKIYLNKRISGITELELTQRFFFFYRMWVSLTFWYVCLLLCPPIYQFIYHYCSGYMQYQLDFKRHRSFILAVLFYNTFYKFNQCILIYNIV